MLCNFPLAKGDHFLKSQPRGPGTDGSLMLRATPNPKKGKCCKRSLCPWLINLSSNRSGFLWPGSMTPVMRSTLPYMFLARSHGGPVEAGAAAEASPAPSANCFQVLPNGTWAQPAPLPTQCLSVFVLARVKFPSFPFLWPRVSELHNTQ